jgi:hypothetical protein
MYIYIKEYNLVDDGGVEGDAHNLVTVLVVQGELSLVGSLELKR